MNKNATIVRRYGTSDIDALIKMTVEEVPKLPNYLGIPVDEARIRFLYTQNIDNEAAFATFILANEDDKPVGAMSVYCTTSMLSWATCTGDIYMFVVEEYRTLENAKKLLLAYKNWAIRRKASIISATVTSGYADAVLDRILTRYLGFKRIGSLYHFRGV